MTGALVALALLTGATAQAGDETIPLTNRPANFSGAAGVYRLQVEADPKEIQVEDPITLKVRIISLEPGPRPNPPVREKLHLFPANIENDFFVEPIPEEDRFIAKENAWEFVWRLAPKRQNVKRIPALEFVYYHTAGATGFKAADGSRTIPIEVKPRRATLLTAPPEALAKFEHIVEGDTVLASEATPDSAWAGLALPPAVCLAGFVLWRRLFPEATERLRRRRSRALKKALNQLNGARAAEVRQVVVEYLRLNSPLTQGEPTPPDVEMALLQRGASAATAASAAELFQRCDEAQFSASPRWQAPHLRETAARVLQTLEPELRSGGRMPGLIAVLAGAALLGTASQYEVAQSHLENAEHHFHAGIRLQEQPADARLQFQAAAADYQKLVNAGCGSADLYLNLGNSHFLASELPRAIEAYRLGLRQNPLSAPLWENLEAARDLVGYPGGLLRNRPTGDDWPAWLPRPSPGFLLQSALALYAIAWAAVWLWLVIRPRGLALVSILLFVVAGVAALAWAYLDYKTARDRDNGLVVVMVNGATFRRGNGSLYPRHPDLPAVSRGMEANWLHERGGWVQMQFPGGEVGWLPRASVIVE
jgi:tetratricopeptide (TPR) repeat protein